MTKEIKFKACKHLDFSTDYTAKKELINSQNTTKVCWNRLVIDSSYPSLVQFCSLRGRLNCPTSCLSEDEKQCNDYEDFEHKIDLSTINLK